MTFFSNRAVLALASIALLWSAQARAQEADPKGYWVTEFKKERVRISSCGKALCGTVAMQKDGKTSSVKILIDMAPDGPNKWRGAAFNPEDGNMYRASMSVENESRLAIEGCAMSFCRKETWTRSKAN